MNKLSRTALALLAFTTLGLTMLMIAIIAGLGSTSLMAQGKSRIAPMSLYKAMFDGNLQSGLVQFRNYNGKQLIYFTALQTMHCRLKEIRYSVNSDALDKRFDIVKCNPQNPFALPPKTGLKDVLISLAPGTAKSVAVQVLWEDGSESVVAKYEPCKDVGDQTCAWPLD